MKKQAKELVQVAKELSASKKEYVIWGIPKGQSEEDLLLASLKGEKIVSKTVAQKFAKLLEEKYGATKTRVQEVDMEGEFDWMKDIGK